MRFVDSFGEKSPMDPLASSGAVTIGVCYHVRRRTGMTRV